MEEKSFIKPLIFILDQVLYTPLNVKGVKCWAFRLEAVILVSDWQCCEHFLFAPLNEKMPHQVNIKSRKILFFFPCLSLFFLHKAKSVPCNFVFLNADASWLPNVDWGREGETHSCQCFLNTFELFCNSGNQMITSFKKSNACFLVCTHIDVSTHTYAHVLFLAMSLCGITQCSCLHRHCHILTLLAPNK